MISRQLLSSYFKKYIEKRHITITSGSSTKVYDDASLTDNTYTISGDGLNDGDYIYSIDITGSEILVGSVSNDISDAIIYDSNDNDVTDMYNITYVTGTLTVTDGLGAEEEPVNDNLVLSYYDGKASSSQNGEIIEPGTYVLGETVTYIITATNIYSDNRTLVLSEIEGVTLSQSTFTNVAPGETVDTTATYTLTERDILAIIRKE